MEAQASPSSSSSSSSRVAGPSVGPLWRLSERRSRKAGTGNIFGGVNLRQLQRLFRAAGDQDAEQRAQLVWGHGDEVELAQALVGLRARGRQRGLRVEGRRDPLGSHWLRAFNHLRIGESTSSGEQGKQQDPQGKTEASDSSWPETPSRAPGSPSRTPPGAFTEDQGPAGPPERPAQARGGPGLKKAVESDPERYLHRILH